MKKFLTALTLTFVLSSGAVAGDIPCDLAPTVHGGTQTASAVGDIPSGGIGGQIPTGGLAAEAEDAFLDGLLAVLGLVN